MEKNVNRFKDSNVRSGYEDSYIRLKKRVKIKTVIEKEIKRVSGKIVLISAGVIVLLGILSEIIESEVLENFVICCFLCHVVSWFFMMYIVAWFYPFPDFDQYKTEELDGLLEYYKEKYKEK